MKKNKSKSRTNSIKKWFSSLSRKTLIWTLIVVLALGGAIFLVFQRVSADTLAIKKGATGLPGCQYNMKTGCQAYFTAKDKKFKANFMKTATAEQQSDYEFITSNAYQAAEVALSTDNLNMCLSVEKKCSALKSNYDALVTKSVTPKVVKKALPTDTTEKEKLKVTEVASKKAVTAKDKTALVACQKRTESYYIKTKAIFDRRDPVYKQGFLANFKVTPGTLLEGLKGTVGIKSKPTDSGTSAIASNETYRQRIKAVSSNLGNLDAETKKVSDAAKKTDDLAVCKKLMNSNIYFYQQINKMVAAIAAGDSVQAEIAIDKINAQAKITNGVLKFAAETAVFAYIAPIAAGTVIGKAVSNVARAGFSKLLPSLIKGVVEKAAMTAAKEGALKIAEKEIASASTAVAKKEVYTVAKKAAEAEAKKLYMQKIEAELAKKLAAKTINEEEKQLALKAAEKSAATYAKKASSEAVSTATKNAAKAAKTASKTAANTAKGPNVVVKTYNNAVNSVKNLFSGTITLTDDVLASTAKPAAEKAAKNFVNAEMKRLWPNDSKTAYNTASAWVKNNIKTKATAAAKKAALDAAKGSSKKALSAQTTSKISKIVSDAVTAAMK